MLIELQRLVEALLEVVEDGGVADDEGDPGAEGFGSGGDVFGAAETDNGDVLSSGVFAEGFHGCEPMSFAEGEVEEGDHGPGFFGDDGQAVWFVEALNAVFEVLQAVDQLRSRKQFFVDDQCERFHRRSALLTGVGLAKTIPMPAWWSGEAALIRKID